MAKQKRKKEKGKFVFEVEQYYQSTSNHYLYAIESQSSIYQLASKLQVLLHTPFYRIGDYRFSFIDRDNRTATAMRRLFAQKNDDEASVNIVLVDNRVDCDTEIVPRKTKNRMHNYSLFPFEYYIFGKQGAKFQANIPPCNYLLLIMCDKSYPIQEITDGLHNKNKLPENFFNITQKNDNQALLPMSAKEKQTFHFLGALSIESDKAISRFQMEAQARLLREKKHWLEYLKKYKLENNMQLPCTILSDKYLDLLASDPSYD